MYVSSYYHWSEPGFFSTHFIFSQRMCSSTFVELIKYFTIIFGTFLKLYFNPVSTSFANYGMPGKIDSCSLGKNIMQFHFMDILVLEDVHLSHAAGLSSFLIFNDFHTCSLILTLCVLTVYEPYWMIDEIIDLFSSFAYSFYQYLICTFSVQSRIPKIVTKHNPYDTETL